MDYGSSLGRRFRGLKLWFVLRAFGVDAPRRASPPTSTWRQLRSWIDDRPSRCSPRISRRSSSRNRGDVINEQILDTVNTSGQALTSHRRAWPVRCGWPLATCARRWRTRATWELIRASGGARTPQA
jgi:hypothetical protein